MIISLFCLCDYTSCLIVILHFHIHTFLSQQDYELLQTAAVPLNVCVWSRGRFLRQDGGRGPPVCLQPDAQRRHLYVQERSDGGARGVNLSTSVVNKRLQMEKCLFMRVHLSPAVTR